MQNNGNNIKTKKIIFLCLAGIFPLGIIFFYLTHLNLLSYVADVLFFGMLLYSIILIRLHVLKIKIMQLRLFVKTLYIVIIIFLPIFLIDSFILDLIPNIPLWFKRIPLFFTMFYYMNLQCSLYKINM